MSTSQPPFRYGLTVTLIAETPSAMTRTSGLASVPIDRHGIEGVAAVELRPEFGRARPSRRWPDVTCAATPRFRRPSATMAARTAWSFPQGSAYASLNGQPLAGSVVEACPFRKHGVPARHR